MRAACFFGWPLYSYYVLTTFVLGLLEAYAYQPCTFQPSQAREPWLECHLLVGMGVPVRTLAPLGIPLLSIFRTSVVRSSLSVIFVLNVGMAQRQMHYENLYPTALWSRRA